MNKQEIERLVELQNRINKIGWMIEKAERSIKIYVSDDYVNGNEFKTLFNQVQVLIINSLTNELTQLTSQRDALVICTGKTQYKPISILDGTP